MMKKRMIVVVLLCVTLGVSANAQDKRAFKDLIDDGYEIKAFNKMQSHSGFLAVLQKERSAYMCMLDKENKKDLCDRLN